MSMEEQTVTLESAANDRVDRYTRLLFLVALLFFLVNIALGFLNALTSGAIPQWQMVTHLHAAALGWFTLTVLGIAIRVFTGSRRVTDAYVRGVGLLTYLSILAVVGYVASFAVGFTQGMLSLLPVFGSGVVLILLAATIYAFSQMRALPVVTTVHVFVASALLVAAVGGTMGVLIGLHRATGTGISDVGAHAPVMLFYILLVASAVAEWFVQPGGHGRWSRAGMGQALALVVAGLVPPIAITLDLMMIMPVMLLGLVVFFVLFLVRIAWKALYTNPLHPGVHAWTFFGTVWLIPVVLLFPAEIAIDPPDWFFPVVAHMAFAGMTTNFLFGVLSDRTKSARRLHGWAEPIAIWLLNVGVLAFVILKITMDSRHGAFIMGLGALLGVVVMGYRLLE